MEQLFVVFVTLMTSSLITGSRLEPNMEYKLKKYLFGEDFNPSVRPVEDSSENVTVFMDMTLKHLVDMNENLQILQSEIWLRLIWYDNQLVWEPADFGNVSEIHVEVGKIWRPDIVVYNDVGLETGKDPRDFLMSVQPDGKVKWLYSRTIETSCKMNVYMFPYDIQKCKYIFGSWALHGHLMDLRQMFDSGDSSSYEDTGEWKLTSIVAERHVKYYQCCTQPFPDVTYTLVLQRRSMYYVFNLILPCILITILHLTSFMLPSESGEKMSLNVTILLGMTVFQLLVAELMPPQSEVIPLISKYFAACIFLVSASTAMSVLILHLHFRGARGFPVTPWVRWLVIDKLGYILCYGSLIKKTGRKFQKEKVSPKEKKIKSLADGAPTLLSLVSSLPLADNNEAPSSENKKEDQNCRSRSNMYRYNNHGLNVDYKVPIEDFGVLHNRTDDKEEMEKIIIQDWILVSLILDRFSLVLFTIGDLVAMGFVLYPLVDLTDDS